jgi:hypothetical protein
VCDSADPLDTEFQEPSVHAFDAATGAVKWQADHGASFSATTIAGGMMFNGVALAAEAIDVRDASSGRVVAMIGLPQLCWSGIATVGDALVFGLGSTADAKGSGIEVLTPGGAPAVMPRSGRRAQVPSPALSVAVRVSPRSPRVRRDPLQISEHRSLKFGSLPERAEP